MPAWSWWLIFAGIAVLAVIVLGCLGLGLWRRAKILLSDLERVSGLAASLSATLASAGRSPGQTVAHVPPRHRG